MLWYIMSLFFLVPERKSKTYPNSSSYLYSHIAKGNMLLFFLVNIPKCIIRKLV